ncbi:MAG: hypothetical protein ISR65_00090 [Bacteriovoracaceae bacterium]|nr:hypothetical protein [Bacteriovoracaceae bacterium]
MNNEENQEEINAIPTYSLHSVQTNFPGMQNPVIIMQDNMTEDNNGTPAPGVKNYIEQKYPTFKKAAQSTFSKEGLTGVVTTCNKLTSESKNYLSALPIKQYAYNSSQYLKKITNKLISDAESSPYLPAPVARNFTQENLRRVRKKMALDRSMVVASYRFSSDTFSNLYKKLATGSKIYFTEQSIKEFASNRYNDLKAIGTFFAKLAHKIISKVWSFLKGLTQKEDDNPYKGQGEVQLRSNLASTIDKITKKIDRFESKLDIQIKDTYDWDNLSDGAFAF